MHNKRQVTQYVGFSSQGQNLSFLRGKLDQNSSSRSSIDKYQDLDMDHWLLYPLNNLITNLDALPLSSFAFLLDIKLLLFSSF